MNTKLLVHLSLLTCLALIFSFIETLIPNPFPIPGAKLGLANIVTLFMLGRFKPREIVGVITCRVLLAGFLFGSVSSIIYSFSGAILSFLVMYGLFKAKFNLLLISIMGGISHNIGQLVLACLITRTIGLVYSYGFYLLLFGFLTGLFNGFIVYFLKKYLPKV